MKTSMRRGRIDEVFVKSALECLKEAARCERLAEIVPTEEDRQLLLDLARQWKHRAMDVYQDEESFASSLH